MLPPMFKSCRSLAEISLLDKQALIDRPVKIEQVKLERLTAMRYGADQRLKIGAILQVVRLQNYKPHTTAIHIDSYKKT
jgi:hypothetical protein